MLRHLTVNTVRIDQHWFDLRTFNLSTNCVSRLFQRELEPYDSGEFRKFYIRASGSPNQLIDDLIDVVIIEEKINIHEYFLAAKLDKKKITLKICYKGCLRIAEKFGFEKDILHKTYRRLKDTSLDHVHYWRKPLSSPNRHLKAQLRGVYDQDDYSFFVDLTDKSGEPVETFYLLKTDPHEGSFYPYAGRLRWLSKTEIALLPRASEIEPVVIDITKPAPTRPSPGKHRPKLP